MGNAYTRAILACALMMLLLPSCGSENALSNSLVGEETPYSNEKQCIVVLYSVILSPAFSKDGLHLAHATTRGGGQLSIVADGREGPEYKMLL